MDTFCINLAQEVSNWECGSTECYKYIDLQGARPDCSKHHVGTDLGSIELRDRLARLPPEILIRIYEAKVPRRLIPTDEVGETRTFAELRRTHFLKLLVEYITPFVASIRNEHRLTDIVKAYLRHSRFDIANAKTVNALVRHLGALATQHITWVQLFVDVRSIHCNNPRKYMDVYDAVATNLRGLQHVVCNIGLDEGRLQTFSKKSKFIDRLLKWHSEHLAVLAENAQRLKSAEYIFQFRGPSHASPTEFLPVGRDEWKEVNGWMEWNVTEIMRGQAEAKAEAMGNSIAVKMDCVVRFSTRSAFD